MTHNADKWGKQGAWGKTQYNMKRVLLVNNNTLSFGKTERCWDCPDQAQK